MINKINSEAIITIAIPVYNAEKYLKDAIQSVINQTFTNWILYLINDGSTDSSLSIMREMALNDSRIIVLDDNLNKGLVARLNQSIELTTTKYYARMDADDIMFITRIEEQVKFMEAHPDIDVIGSSVMTIDCDNNIIGSGMSFGKVCSFIHPTVLGRIEWFKANPYCCWALRAEDFELWCRTSSKSNFWALDIPLLFYREFAVPTIKKYIKTQISVLKIYSRYKIYNKTLSWFIKNSLLVVLKVVFYLLFGLFDKTDVLIRKRRRESLPSDKWLTKEDLIKSIAN